MDIVKFLTLATVLSLLPGQIIRVPLSETTAVTLTDILCSLTVVSYFFLAFLKKERIFINKFFALSSSIFLLLATTSIILALDVFPTLAVATSSLFLIRFALYLLFVLPVASMFKKITAETISNVLITIGLLFAIIGIAQLIFIPDLSFLTVYGWDPHQRRIATSLLDPNFSGYIYTFFFAVATSAYLFKKKLLYLFASAVFFSCVLLTLSRSSYLALAAAVVAIGLFKSPKTLVISSFVFVALIFMVPQAKLRIEGAFSFDETSQARVESWQRALDIYRDKPAFGVGFNTYRLAQESHGFFDFDSSGGHSGGGSDSSFFFVLATSGLVGFAAYLMLLASIAKIFIHNIKTNYLSLAGTTAFVALLVHTQFVNSLFYPQIMMLLFFTLGVVLAHDS